MAQGRAQKGHRALLSSLIALHFRAGYPAVSVHRSKDVRPAGRAVPILSVLGHPVPRSRKAGELLGVQVQEHARRLNLKVLGQGSGFQER